MYPVLHPELHVRLPESEEQDFISDYYILVPIVQMREYALFEIA